MTKSSTFPPGKTIIKLNNKNTAIAYRVGVLLILDTFTHRSNIYIVNMRYRINIIDSVIYCYKDGNKPLISTV